jgi:hypothetical protein
MLARLRGVTAVLTVDTLFVSLIIFWPFVFLWPYVLGLISVGNDFSVLYYSYKLSYVAFLTEGHVPLWASTEAAGFPFFSNPFVAATYPLNALYLLHYRIFGGLTRWDYTLYTIMGLSIYGVGFFLWLRTLSIGSSIALAAALIVVMSLKLTEILRFPNALHSAAWMPWLLLGITLASGRKRLIAGSMMFGIASLMLLTAGYPYYIVYAVFLVAPYLLAVLFARTRLPILGCTPDDPTGPVRLVLWIGTSFFFAAALAYPWLSQVQNLMAQTVDRATPNFSFATHLSFSFTDTVGSWIFPPAALMEGWYYFGMAPALLIFIHLLSLVSHGRRRDRQLLLLVLPWLAFVIYFTWGRDSAVFTWVWQHTPVVNQMRAWSRMNVILVPVIGLLLALALSTYLRVLETQTKEDASEPVIFLLPVVICVIVTVQGYMLHNRVFSPYWELYFKTGVSTGLDTALLPWSMLRNFDERYFVAMTVIAGGVLVGMLLLSRRTRCFSRAVSLTAIVTVSAIDLFPLSSLQWHYPPVEEHRMRISITGLLKEGFSQPRLMTAGTVDPTEMRQYVGLLENWGFVRHATFYLKFFDLNGTPLPTTTPEEVVAAKRLYGADARAQRLFFSKRIDYTTPVKFMADVDEAASTAEPAVDILAYDGETLTVTARANRPGWLSFIDNWDPNWTATLNGQQVQIALLFGSYKAVEIPAGVSNVVFSYKPKMLPQGGR